MTSNTTYMKVEELKPYDKNAKEHPKKQVDAIARSIQEFGFNQPIVVDKDNVIIVGHGRLLAGKKLGLTEVPVMKLSNLTPEQVNAYRLADNKLNESDWDMKLVVEELRELDSAGFDIEVTGFIRDILGPDDKDDEVPEIPVTPRTQVGDLYELGDHRLLCGDSTKTEDMEKLFRGNKADMVFTDPPYNTGIQQGRASKEWGIIENDAMSETDFAKFCKAFVDVLYKYSEGDKYICMSWSAYDLLYQAMPNVKNCIVWVKNNFGLGHGYRPQHEFILFDGGNIKANDESNVWFEKKDGATEYKHPTQKPVALAARAINNSAKAGQTILDLFLGSGSTLIACEKTNRNCYGLELDPKFADVIVQRWVNFTGNTTVKKNGVEEQWEVTEQK